MPGCVFCDIVSRQRDAFEVDRTEATTSFLDTSPLFPGHVLVVPNEHHETLMDLPARLLEPLFGDVRRVSGAVRVAMGAEGVFVAANNIVSQSVPHLHVHVVPRRRKDGLRGFFWPRQRYEDDRHAAATADAIVQALAGPIP